MLTRKKLITAILLTAAIVLLVNLLSEKIFFRLDFTSDQRYSLSDATEDILDELEEPVTVTAFFSEDLPPDVERIREEFSNMLREYESSSDGMVAYEFINPNEDQEQEIKAQQNGIMPVMINVREKDQMKQQRAYLGALLQAGDNSDVIPLVDPNTSMEFALSSSIKKIASQNKAAIGLLQGHGEPPLNALQQVSKQLSVMYNVEPVTLTDTAGVPPYLSALLVVAPEDSVPPQHFACLEEFLQRGGKLLLALNVVNGDEQTQGGREIKTGFKEWLSKYGVNIESSFAIDVNCSNVMVTQQQGMIQYQTPVQFPFIPIITNFGDHTIGEGIESVTMIFASPIYYNNPDTSVKMYPVAQTSERAGIVDLPIVFNINKEWTVEDFPESNLNTGIALEGNIAGVDSRMVIFSDGDFAVNGVGQNAQQLQEDNINLMVNSVDWLTDDTGLIELRTKTVTSRPIDPTLSQTSKSLFKYINFLLPILLIIIYGVARAQIRKKLSSNLKQMDFNG